MKNKLKLRLRIQSITLILALLCFSCSKLEDGADLNNGQDDKAILLTPEEIVSIAFDDPKELSEQEVLNVLKEFQIDDDDPTVKGGLKNRRIVIEQRLVLNEYGDLNEADEMPLTKGSSSGIPIYKASISSDNSFGYAFVCADERLPAVIAYASEVHEGEMDMTDHPMYLNSLETVMNTLDYYGKLKDSLRSATLEKLNSIIDRNLPEEEIFKSVRHRIKPLQDLATKSLVTPQPETSYISKVGPFTYTRWAQNGLLGMENAYNYKMPLYTCNGTAMRPPAGCVTVAVAQIFAHIMPAMTVPAYTGDPNDPNIAIDWSLLRQTPNLDWDFYGPRVEMMGSLMRSVAEELSSSYDCSPISGTSAYTVLTSASMASAINVINSRIQIGNLVNFSTQVCKQSLDNLKIVLASGDRSATNPTGKVGHAWIIDGYAICQKGTQNGDNGTNDLPNRFDMYLHANLGWGESGATGWYLVNNDWSVTFDTGSGTGDDRQHYRLNMKCAPNVSM